MAVIKEGVLTEAGSTAYGIVPCAHPPMQPLRSKLSDSKIMF